MKNNENKNVKNKVGRPKGTKNKVGAKVGRPKLENKRDKKYILSFRVNSEEEEIIFNTFKSMGMDINKIGAKKKMFFNLMNDFLKKNK